MLPRPTFYLRGGSSTAEVAIRCIVRMNAEQVYLSTGYRCRAKDWDKRRMRVRSTASHAAITNDALDTMELRVRALIKELHTDKRLTPDTLRTAWEEEGQPAQPETGALTLSEALTRWKGAHTNLRTDRTFATYETAIAHLAAALDRPDTEIPVREVGLLALQRMVSYLITDRSLSTVAAWKSVRIARTLIAWCEEQGETVDATYRQATEKRMMPSASKTAAREKVRLTDDEYRALRDADLSAWPHLERARDTWVFQSCVGLRWGDMVNLRPEHRIGNELDLTTMKNKKSVRVPLTADALAIWDRYGEPPPVVSAQKQNDYIKEAARIAGLERLVRTVMFKGVNRQEQTVMLWEVLSTHAAKRTFVTSLVASGLSVDDVMKVTGNTRRTIEPYIKLDHDEVAAKVLGALNKR